MASDDSHEKRPPHARKRIPSFADYDPARQRPAVEEKRLSALFPGDLPMEERMSRVESAAFDVIQEQIRVAPQIAAATAYVNDETNARTSAMEFASRMHGLLADVKRTQRVSESRTKLMYAALGAVVVVIIGGMWAKTDPATLVTLAGAVGGVALAIVNSVSKKAGVVRQEDEEPPTPKPPST